MFKLFKILMVCALLLSLCTYGTPVLAAIEVTPVTIPVSVAVSNAGTYSLTAALSGTLTFDLTGVTVQDPWRVGSAYVNIDLNAPTNATWGLRIVTDNVADLTAINRNSTTGVLELGTPPVAVTPDATANYNAGGGVIFAGFDTTAAPGGPYSYAGLIRTSAMDNPSMRAPLAWQVQGYDTLGAAVSPATPTKPTLVDAAGVWTEVGDWNDIWAYLSDKANSDYRSSTLVTNINTHTGGKVVYRDDTNNDGVVNSSDSFVTNYTLVAYGTPYGRYLATHPYTASQMRPLSSTEGGTSGNPWDIFVYLTAKFSNTDYSGTTPTSFVLPAGSYTTSIYLDLFSE